MKPDAADTLKTRPTLLSKVRRGDEDGWVQFYELYEDFVYSAARVTGLSHEESMDVLQDTMISVRDYISHFVPDKTRAQFRTWLRRVVQSRIADQYRKKSRSPLEKVQHDAFPDETASSTTNRIPNLNEVELDRLIDGQLEQAILNEARRLAKAKVRMEDYQTYDLFQIQDLGAREVGISLGISPVTVRVRALRVRRAIETQVRRLVKLLEQPRRGLR